MIWRYLFNYIKLWLFGTGYSLFSYIKRFLLHKLEIVREFAKEFLDNEGCLVIVEAILAMTRRSYIKIISESVEVHEQVNWLHKVDCDVSGTLLLQYSKQAEFSLLIQCKIGGY